MKRLQTRSSLSAIAAAVLALPLVGVPALAQAQRTLAQAQRICVVDQQTNRVSCGRAATQVEVDRSDYGRGNHTGRVDDRWGNPRYEPQRGTSNRSWSSIYDDLDKVFVDVLGRNINNGELRAYTRRLEQGRSLADVRGDVARSKEAEQALDRVYQAVLGRGIDPSGLQTYRRKLAQGDSLRSVERELRRSAEALRR